MKLFKKLLALTLVLCMVFCLSSAVFAADGDGSGDSTTPTYPSDQTTVTVKKEYKLDNPNMTSPAETFKLIQTNAAFGDDVQKEDNDTVPDLPKAKTEGTEVADVTIGSTSYRVVSQVSVAEGDAGKKNDDNSVIYHNFVINLPEASSFPNVGTYKYTLKEVESTTAGVTCREDTLLLVITVINAEGSTDNHLRIAAVHTEKPENGVYGTKENGKKSDKIDNTYSAGTLNVKKLVSGKLADTKDTFKFTVNFVAPDGLDVQSTINYGENKNIAPSDWKDVTDSETSTTRKVATVEIELKHDATVSFTNIPYGVAWSVTEESPTAKGYTATSFVVTSTSNTTGTTGNVLTAYDSNGISDAVTNVVFTNFKDGNIDMGVSLDSLPYILALAAAFGGAVVMITRKRHVED